MDEELLISKDCSITTLTINRPHKGNALTPSCLLKMAAALKELAETRRSQPVVIRGAGDRAFSSGYDLNSLPTGLSPEEEEECKKVAPLDLAMEAIQSYPFPVLAMLNGYAFGGGCELAVACDLRLAGEHVRMGMPPAKLGLVYPYSGYRRFLNVLGLSRTLEIFLTGREYDSQACLQIGLVHYVKPQQDLEAFTHELASELADNAPLSLKGSKYALYKIAENATMDLADEDKIRSLYIQSLQSEDLEEGEKSPSRKTKTLIQGAVMIRR